MDLRALDPSNPQEVAKVLELFEQVFGRPLSPPFYRWRFLENPFGPPLVTLLWDGPTLAGHYAASAMRGWHRRAFDSSQSMTTMTHPDYRNRDVFTTLADHLYRRMATEHGIKMIWGYPNTRSHFGLVRRLGWHDVALLPTMTRELTTVDAGDNGIAGASTLPDGIDDLFLRSDDGRAFLSARDERYMRWRYVQNPDIEYTYFSIRGEALAVTKEFDVAPGVRSLEVVDFLYAGNPGRLAELIRDLLAWAKKRGFAYVRAWVSLWDPLYPFLEKLAFVPREPLTYFCIRPIVGGLESSLDHPQAWVVTMGDSDNY